MQETEFFVKNFKFSVDIQYLQQPCAADHFNAAPASVRDKNVSAAPAVLTNTPPSLR
jgi:hypothetical protein